MTSVVPKTRGATTRRSALVAATALLGLAACSGNEPAAPADEPAASIDGPALRRAAFIIDVDVKARAVKITKPAASLPRILSENRHGGNINYSLLGEDAIQLTATNFFASQVGALQPNKIEVFFDLAVTNLLPGITLTTSTLPTPPAGQVGLILFPFSTTVTTSSGGAGGTGGSDVVIELPSRGQVVASRDWNGNASLDRPTFPVAPGAGGNPHNFFNDATCPAESSTEVASDCFRYETYGNLGGGVTSATRRVGFTVDGGVAQFRARIIAAADLLVGAVGTGTINVLVSSPQRGPLAGLPIAVSGITGTQTTSAAGTATFTSVATAVRSVWIGGVDQLNLSGILPAGCTRVTPVNGQFVNVTAGGTFTVDYSVECTPLLGTVTATITRTGAGTQSLDGSTFTITPAAAGLTPVAGQLAGLGFSRQVGVGFGTGAGEGTVALSNLPNGCTQVAAPASYTGLTAGGSVAVALTVDCVADTTRTRYRFVSQFGAISAGTVDLTLSFDPSGFDSPLIPGPDAFAGGQGIVTLTGGAEGRVTGRSAVPTANFGTATLGGTLPVTAWSAVSTVPGGFTGNQLIAVIRYSLGSGAPGTIVTATTLQEINTPTGDNLPLTGNVEIIEGTLVVP